ncbi:helix-turn-helix domain-containing protein [Natrarchaeobius sp. A-rgal3]|uniref:helix-turn-helix domain-containing protein n=1 Tax=Natrarchaeobius versutus TaxID=1679078 RepID=UPI00350F4426
MNAVRVAITHAKQTIHPVHSLVCTDPELSRELLFYFDVTDGCETAINYVEGDPDVYERALHAQADVEDCEVYRDANGGCYSYLRSELDAHNRRLAAAFRRETLAVVPPVEFLPDRRMIVSLVGTSTDVREIRNEIPDAVSMEVVSVGSIPGSTRSALTAKQRRAIETAWELGYYELPREANLEAIASELECAISTVSNLLRRAHATLVAAELGVTEDGNGRVGGVTAARTSDV